MRKIILAGQISSLFGGFMLSLRHFFVAPANHYSIVLLIVIIGFIPSLIAFHSILKRFTPLVIVCNALIIVSSAYMLMGEVALSGLFLLVPVLSLLFKNRKLYFFSATSSVLLFLLMTKDISSSGKMVVLLDHLTSFLIMIFLIFLVVQELIDNTKKETKQIHTIMSLSRSVEARDFYTKGHSQRVALLSKIISKYIPEVGQELAYQTGVIHDVGKLTTPDMILLKKGKLTAQEYNVMKKHPSEGAHICRSLGIPEEYIDGVLYHHERWDGQGYPKGLKGEEIPLIARIIGISDAIDAMSSNRSYRKAMDFNNIREEIEQGKGTQFDPAIAQLVLDNWGYIVEKVHRKNLDLNRNPVELAPVTATGDSSV
ncbi:HD-GYP domain-containing protein [Virgibacillus sp. W0181]|uniref:HD-GYP domain-containing protein n=1 Tax=Virgibacillus sp. W0181 TaxID=3391581 RepID=UPI003F47273D